MYSPRLEHGSLTNTSPEEPQTFGEQYNALVSAPDREQFLTGVGTSAVLTPAVNSLIPNVAVKPGLLNEMARIGMKGVKGVGVPMLTYEAGNAGYKFIDGVFDHLEKAVPEAQKRQRENYEKREDMMPGVVGVNDNPLVIEKKTTMEFTPMPMEEFMPKEEGATEEMSFEDILKELEQPIL